MISKPTGIGIIFLSGAGLHGWIWDKIAQKVAVPSVSATFATLGKQSSLDDYVATALKQANTLNATKIVIVAHSIGGVVGVELAKKLGDRLGGFIAISAAIPDTGKSFLSVFPFPQRTLMQLVFALAGTRPPESAIRKGLCNDIDSEQTERVIKDFTPEAVKLYTDSTSAKPFPHRPTLYISTSNDKNFSSSLQAAMSANLPNGKRVAIDSGHLPMISHPDDVVTYINDFLLQLSSRT